MNVRGAWEYSMAADVRGTRVFRGVPANVPKKITGWREIIFSPPKHDELGDAEGASPNKIWTEKRIRERARTSGSRGGSVTKSEQSSDPATIPWERAQTVYCSPGLRPSPLCEPLEISRNTCDAPEFIRSDAANRAVMHQPVPLRLQLEATRRSRM